MATDMSEKGLETILVEGFCDHGWIQGSSGEFDPSWALDLEQLATFLADTQPELVEAFDLHGDSPARTKALARIQGEITSRGIIDVLRKGISHGPHDVTLFFPSPSKGNVGAAELFALNRFSVTRQLHFSPDVTKLSLDVCLFINGLPVITFELKNSLTKQTVQDAISQYEVDRDPKELIFQFKRCLAHFAVDDSEAWFTTKLEGKASWFLPFNKGVNDGAGNPVNPNGVKTSYLWEGALTVAGLSDIIENYAQLVETEDPNTKKKKYSQIFPRYHQLDVVRRLLAEVAVAGPGRRYLCEEAAGGGKSNDIAWLAHQIIRLERPDENGLEKPIFDTVLVVTDRRNLDRQIRDTIKQFAQVGSLVGHAKTSTELATLLAQGKKIIITTVQKFPFILDAIGEGSKERNFAIIIDEAHSSQGGRTSSAMAKALAGAVAPDGADGDASGGEGEDGDAEEDEIQDLINEAIESRKMLTNASYFAFTATPKNKTLEMFGTPFMESGQKKFMPFHHYSMKQAIEEGFILDVLKSYTPVNSYYRLVKTAADDPEYDTKRAVKKLRSFVESHDHAVRAKAEIMVNHFLEQVVATGKIGGQARAMVVTSSIKRAIQYFKAFQAYLEEIQSPYNAIVAFSGDHEVAGKQVSEADLNGFPSKDIEKMVKTDPYRFLICADKFQTGYDEPLLHTMYVDKVLSGIKAVQTLSRLNRAHPKKYDTFVLDFQNDVDGIRDSFAPFYRTTILSDETDANKLHDLQKKLDDSQIYNAEQLNSFVSQYLRGAERTKLDPILDACVDSYKEQLDEDGQVEFKGGAKAFVRTYDFLASILPYTNADWEKRSIFLNFLIPKLPAPAEEDLSKGILESIDMDSYRLERQAAIQVLLPDEEAEINPIPTGAGGGKPEPELEKLSDILKAFNDLFGNIDWTDKDRIRKIVTEEIPAKVNADEAYRNAKQNSDKQNARVEHDKALERAILSLITDDTELFKAFMDNPDFKKWLSDTVFGMTYEEAA